MEIKPASPWGPVNLVGSVGRMRHAPEIIEVDHPRLEEVHALDVIAPAADEGHPPARPRMRCVFGRPQSTLVDGSAILSGAASPRLLAGILRFDFLPKSIMRDAASLSKSLSRSFQDRLQLGRAVHR